MKKLVIAILAMFALSAVAFAEEHGTAPAGDHAAPAKHEKKHGSKKAKKEKKAEKHEEHTEGATH